MGQSHSQPSGGRRHDQSNAVASPLRESSAAEASASPQRDIAASLPRRRTPSSAPRKRLSTLLRGKRPETVVEPSFNELGEPLNTANADPSITVPPLSVKSRSFRRLFNRRSWAPSSTHEPRGVAPAQPDTRRQPEASQSPTTASSSQNVADRVALEPGYETGDPSEQASSSAFTTPQLLSESNDYTGRRAAPTKREIAMLSGTSSSSSAPTRGLSGSSETPSTPSATMASTDPSSDPADSDDAPISVVLEEDPAALGGLLPPSRPASWHSFTHQESHEADLASVDAISVAEVGEENKPHSVAPIEEEPIPMTEEIALDMDLRSDGEEASHPRSSAAEPGSSIATAMSELASSISSLPPTSTLPVLNENPDNTGSTIRPSLQPPIVPPPLPVIPAGTTMIIQGVVQAAEEPPRPPRRRPESTVLSPTEGASTSGVESEDANGPSSNAPASNAHARLPGTFGEESEAARRSSQESENPNGAAELLGALLIAAASATANMLMSDPPGSSNATTPSPPNTEQTTNETPATTEPLPSPPVEPPAPRSSVGVGPRPRPRPRTMYSGDGNSAPDHLGRNNRPRSLMSTLRDRLLGPSPEEEAVYRLMRERAGHRRSRSERLLEEDLPPVPSQEETTRDPIESLRERIASELMRALANREGQSEDPASSNSGSQRQSGLYAPSTPLNEQGPSPVGPANGGGLTSLPLSLPSPSIPPAGAAEPPEGSFERFLQDTNAELRRTLQERINNREAAISVPIEVPVTQETAAAEGTPTDAPSDAPSQEGEASQETQGAPTATRLVHRAPEGVIEPRLNWWRMHRFPARTVAAAPSSETNPPAPSGPAEPTPIPEVTVNDDPSSSSPATPAPQASTILIPVIVVGIRTAPTTLVQEIGALAAPPPPPVIPDLPINDSGRPSLYHRNGSSSSITIRAPQDRAPAPRPPWARVLESMARSLAARRRAERERLQRNRESMFGGPSVEPPPMSPSPAMEPPTVGASADGDAAARDRTRNYLIWVIGGYYPESHPILTSPNLLLNQFDQDDFWGLAELLGQVKPPVASKTDIEQSGLEIIKASQVVEYEKEGRITSNTSERCLICLSDYEPDEDIRVMTCKHAFHQPCVDKWLEVGRNNCPACRSKGVDVQETPSTSSETPGQSGEPSTSTV